MILAIKILEVFMHKSIILKDISLSFSNKNCFKDFSTQIYPGDRIAIIGRNGSGKSSLLNIIKNTVRYSDNSTSTSIDICVGYVEQTINDLKNLSGGQRLNKKLSEALSISPDLLLLDEPTNHLDKSNRKSLMRMLNNYQGTLIVVSHDIELLQSCINTFWHIDNNRIHQFSGSYNDYMREKMLKFIAIQNELEALKKAHKETHNDLMKEQRRAAKSKSKGQKSIKQRKWPTVVSKAKALRAEQTSGKKRASIDHKKKILSEQMSEIELPEVISPKFSISSTSSSNSNLIYINDGSVGYNKQESVLENINISLSGSERIAISGDNASGKSTLIKAILKRNEIVDKGEWLLPKSEHIGYLDQHYSNLKPDLSIYEQLKLIKPEWDNIKLRRHLCDFLFKKNEEVMLETKNLSGGEKARASLSLISAKTPRILILDEITNNLDLETKEHVIQVIKEFPGSLIVVSHEDNFIESICIERKYIIADKQIFLA